MSHGLCAIALANGKAYLLQGATYTRFDFTSGLVEQSLPTAGSWPGLQAQAADARVYYGFGKAYFFSGENCVRYEVGSHGGGGGRVPGAEPAAQHRRLLAGRRRRPHRRRP